jgi:hypothetical protein
MSVFFGRKGHSRFHYGLIVLQNRLSPPSLSSNLFSLPTWRFVLANGWTVPAAMLW